METPNDEVNLLVVLPPVDVRICDNDESAPWCQQGKRVSLRLPERNRIKYVRDGDIGNLADLFLQSCRRKGPVYDVRRAKGGKQVFVTKRRCRDNGRETGQLRKLDGYTKQMLVHTIQVDVKVATYHIVQGKTRLP